MQVCSRPKTSFHLIFPLFRNVDDGNFNTYMFLDKKKRLVQPQTTPFPSWIVMKSFFYCPEHLHSIWNSKRKKKLQKCIENAAKLCHISYSRVALLLWTHWSIYFVSIALRFQNHQTLCTLRAIDELLSNIIKWA